MDKNIINKRSLPLVYSCSGCSNIAQLANNIALDLDRTEIAEMSCIAGVGGGVEPLVRLARSGRAIIAIDGCNLHCTKHCLNQQNVSPTLHYTLTDFGIKKYHSDFESNHIETILEIIERDLILMEVQHNC